MKMNSKGQIMPYIMTLFAVIVIIGLVGIIVANQPQLGGGQGTVSQWCTTLAGETVPAASGLCASIPFEAVGTLQNPPTAPSASGTNIQPQYQVTTISYTMNPIEKYLTGSATGTITCNRKVGGSWLSDINNSAATTLAINNQMTLLCGDDDGSGTDYYKRIISENTGIITPYDPTYFFTREGTLSHTITLSNGITENAQTTAASADINASQTYYYNVKSENTTSYSCYGNEDTTKKVAVTIDANYNGEISKATPFGITSTTGATVPPSHTTDTNATTSRAFNIPSLNLCNGESTNWKLKVEGLSTMSTDLGSGAGFIQRLRVCFYDYTYQRNTDTGHIVETTFDPVSNADIGVTSTQCENFFYH